MTKLQSLLFSLFSFFLLTAPAFAEEAEAICRIQPNMLSKLALYGIPFLVTVGLGFLISRSWGYTAVGENRPPSGEQRAGWLCGLFLGALTFSGMLYGVSEYQNEKGDITTSTCYPDGWGVIAGVLVAITLIVFIIAKLSARK